MAMTATSTSARFTGGRLRMDACGASSETRTTARVAPFAGRIARSSSAMQRTSSPAVSCAGADTGATQNPAMAVAQTAIPLKTRDTIRPFMTFASFWKSRREAYLLPVSAPIQEYPAGKVVKAM